MGTIETTYDLPKDLTTFKVVGKMQLADFYDCLTRYYEGEVTSHTLWDITEVDFSVSNTDEIRDLAQYAREIADARIGGKTAIVTSDDLGYGVGRMFEAFYEMARVPFEIQAFRSLDEAKKWIGVGECKHL